MSQPKRDQLIRLVPRSEVAHEIAAFVIDRQARGLSPRTVEFYADELRYLRSFLDRQKVSHIEQITPTLVRRYLLHLGQTRNPGGLHAAYRAIRAFLRWFEAEYEPQGWTNPIDKVAAPRVPRKQLDPASLPDLKAMLATCDRRTFLGDRDRAILLALLDTGCRASEFVALDVTDVNLSTGVAIISRGKGSKERAAFLGARTRREVVRYLRHRKDTGPLWVTVQGGRLTYSGLRQIVRRRAVRAGVPVPSLHSFRRAFALTCLRAGMDIYSLQKLMGHSDLAVLRQYLKQTEADLRAAHMEAGPVDKCL